MYNRLSNNVLLSLLLYFFVVVIFAWETTKNMKKEQNRSKVTSKPNIYSQVLHIQNKNVMNTSVLSYTGKKRFKKKFWALPIFYYVRIFMILFDTV